MKKAAVLVVAAVMLFARPVHAADLSYTSFASDITVNTDASIDVRETIVVEFLTEKHGIYRNIPYRFTLPDGGSASIPIENVSVMMDGHSEQASITKSGGQVVAKIGDPDTTISGTHTYQISYRALAAVNFFSDHDELYWNVSGDQWDAALPSVTATVHLPPALANTAVQVTCYSGEAGSTEKHCNASQHGSDLTYAASTFLTIVAGFPTGIVTKPAEYDSLRSSTDTGGSFLPVSKTTILWIVFANLLAIVGIIVWAVRWWRTNGRDPKSKGTVIAQYDPPNGMRPGEVGTLYDERADPRDVIATIVDLAVRGYLVIEETEKTKVLGFGGGKDYRLVRKKQSDQELRPYERTLMAALFEEETSVTLSNLKGSFADDLRAVQKRMYEQTVTDGLFVKNPDAVRKKYFFTGLALLIVGGLAVFVGMIVLPLAGIVLMLMARAMPQRTAKGVEATWHARGFREFLHTAERYRLQWQEKEHIFEQFLPYAMVFGVAEQWTKTFKDIAMEQPSWYRGSPGSTFNSLMLFSAMNSFTTAATQSFVPPAATGSSGFGSGGFSGGGGGGGGGGGW